MALPILVSCSLKYDYDEPTAEQRAELAALTEPGLEVDTGRIPDDLPPGPVTASLDHHHNNYFLTASINGRDVDLVVDWGSWVTLALFPYVVRGAEATLSDRTMRASTIDYRGEMRTGIVDTMTIGETTLRNVPFAMLNRDLTVKLGGFTVYRGKGLIGLPILAGFDRFAIDLANDSLHLGRLPGALSESPDAITIPFEIDNGMVVEATLEGVPMRLKVDIGGYHGFVMLDDDAARAFAETHIAEFSGYSTGVGEAAVRSLTARAKVVRLGSYERGGVPVKLLLRDERGQNADNAQGASHDPGATAGVIGHAFFGATIVGVDWSARELTFIPFD